MSLLSALINVATGETVSEEQQRHRMSHCKRCVKMRGNICIICKCYLPLKTLSPDEKCPLPNPKWSKIEEE